jgi:hypothetical protein
MDQFKKYLRDHRGELDVEIAPPAPLWSRKPVKHSETMSVTRWMVAASILLIVSLIFYWMPRHPNNNETSYNKPVKNDSVSMQTKHDSLRSDVAKASNSSIDLDSGEATLEEPKSEKSVVAKRSAPKGKSKSQRSPLQSLETNYAAIIDYQLKRVERTPIYAESADYFHVFKKQWYDLEKDEEKIKDDIQVLGLNDIVVDQFIRLYQNKIELLKQLQSQIDKMNLRARNHPGFHNQTPTFLKM